VVCVCVCAEGSAAALQRPNGLRHVVGVRLELWNSRHDLCLLERSSETAAGDAHHHSGSDGAGIHQVHPRLDTVATAGCSLSLGSVGQSVSR